MPAEAFFIFLFSTLLEAFPLLNHSVALHSEPSLRLRVDSEPLLFAPLRAVLSQGPADALLYVNLESRPLDVLPGREDGEWRVIAAKSIHSRPPHQELEFGCEWLTATGFYRIRAKIESLNLTLLTPEVRISRAPPLDTPRLLLRADSIFPHCTHELHISWHLPNCSIRRQSDEFRIRLSAIQADGMEVYMGEMRAAAEVPRSTALPCSQFDILYERFCFELVSIQSTTQQLDLWERRCVSTEPVNRVDGGWSDWSEWSACSRSCGGGRRKRRRQCSNPRPMRGRACEGAVLDTEACQLEALPPAAVASPSNSSLGCECGCTLTQTHGALFAGRSAHCSNHTLEWKVPARPLAKIRLVFVDRLAENEILRIVDVEGQETYWLNGHTRPAPQLLMMPLDTALSIVLSALDGELGTTRSGVFIDYEIIRAPQPTDDGAEYSALLGSRFVSCQSKQCHAVVTVVSLLICLALIMALVAIPPLLCALFTRRRMRHSVKKSPLLASMHDSDMVRSGGTDSTQVSDNGALANGKSLNTTTTTVVALNGHSAVRVAQRSIGVQRSAQTTPRAIRSALETPAPNGSIDLEYDYYEPIVPGSLLRPGLDIDIEQIIRSETSGWVEKPEPSNEAPI